MQTLKGMILDKANLHNDEAIIFKTKIFQNILQGVWIDRKKA